MKIDQLIRLIDDFAYGPDSNNPGMQPSHVITMAGINDMYMSKTTNKVNISRLYSALKRQFPNSKISFCLVPMIKTAFTDKQYETIQDLNREIQSFCDKNALNCIPKLPKEDFETDPADPIHWTPACANKTFEHIMNHLN